MGPVKLDSSAPYISARQTSSIMQVEEQTGVEITITLQPGMSSGAFRETVTAYTTGAESHTATLSISGYISGDITCVPPSLTFSRSASEPGKTTTIKRLQIFNRSAQSPLQIKAAKDPDERLHLELRTVKEGRRYEVIATVKAEALENPGTVSGAIHLATDNAGQKNITVNYVIYNQL